MSRREDRIGEVMGFCFLGAVGTVIAVGALCLAVVFVIGTYRYVTGGPLVSTVCVEDTPLGCHMWKVAP